MAKLKWENVSWFYNETSGCGTEICFYDNTKYDEINAFGNELAIYPSYGEPDELENCRKWLKEDGIIEDEDIDLNPYYNCMC